MSEIMVRTGKTESIMPVLESAIRNQLKMLGETKILKRLEEEYRELEGMRICL